MVSEKKGRNKLGLSTKKKKKQLSKKEGGSFNKTNIKMTISTLKKEVFNIFCHLEKAN